MLLTAAIWVLTMLNCTLNHTPCISKPSLRYYMGSVIGQLWSVFLLSVEKQLPGVIPVLQMLLIARFDVTSNTSTFLANLTSEIRSAHSVVTPFPFVLFQSSSFRSDGCLCHGVCFFTLLKK